jgi:predicted ferric reductase
MRVLLLAAAGLGALAALAVVPAWLPVLHASLAGAEPKAYWYLARASALVAYVLLWLAMALGLTITNKLARVWPGGPTAFDLHQHTSLLGLAAGLFHGLMLLGDRYIGYTVPQVLVPFAAAGYRPLWVGMGQLALYGLAVVALSFYVRRRIGQRAWRVLHFLSFAVFALALAHGLTSGTDSTTLWAQALYSGTGGSLLFLTLYRVLARRLKPAPRGGARAPAQE